MGKKVVVNDGEGNLDPEFVRRIAMNIRAGAKIAIEHKGNTFLKIMLKTYTFFLFIMY